MTQAHRIVVLGGGSGGLELASALAGRAGRAGLAVTLVDRVGSHLWKPRLHEFAAGTVTSTLSEISFYMLADMRGFRFEQGCVEAIDRSRRTVRLASITGADGESLADARDVAYDTCVVALGGQTADFGTPGVAGNAIRLDAKADADAFRERFVSLMIHARETGRAAKIVIVGSGATGTELAAHLRVAERAFFDRAGEPPDRLLEITILEAAAEIMPGSDEALREGILERLSALDVAVVTGAKISSVERGEVRSAAGHWPADITVWAAGSSGLPVLARLADFNLDAKGRIRVDEHLRTDIDERIFALGDAASLTLPGEERPLPPTAQVASQEAAYLAGVLPETIEGRVVLPFRFKDKGKLVSLGRAGTVGLLGLGRRNDVFIDGQFATAAYNALQRQHQWAVLGPLRGSLAIFADMVSPARGPALKLHG
ncbi:NADH dehydrogenase [Aureimonas sp. Leaf454]|uniref:NAD(P)/FAD-dependent oxidoreductase n=1 Tax=Aureimonas sp. Leaf454 TaxID=1736381 RepID=UPI0006F2A9E6|nr:FAD-dependent oxidoreductase [Aureimonas sp. Leaf454]KQT46200.1 NADH dehydrogenase [Aureimonas sp. Leaf454]